MKKEYLKIGLATVWVLSIAFILNFLAIIVWGINQPNFSLIYPYLVLNSILLIILVNDIYLNPIREKWFWMFSMFVLLPIASVTYLARRRKLFIKN